ncbi:MAG: L-2-hydroxyglutarate oxidase [Solirubrobacteraceae bacterium]
MSERADIAVVGGGILGLAVACELQRGRPRGRVCVLEREAEPARHQSSHNSGVIHAGIYYEPGSLKALLCRAGAAQMYAFCETHGVAHQRCGKLIVACSAPELAQLERLERRARANGVPGLRRLNRAEIPAVEPHAGGIAALHSPETGIADFAGVARALARELQADGGELLCGAGVHDVRVGPREVELRHTRGTLRAANAVYCAGAWADRLAVAAGAPADPRIVPFRGAYLRLLRPELVRGLIYPVPDPSLPFLGVHLTRTVDGSVLLGPTALLALARDVDAGFGWADARSALGWPGTWRMFARHRGAGLQELHHALRRSALVGAARRLVPELRATETAPAFAGVRAQALARDGRLLDDFAFSATPRALHVRNAPSPGATAALAIAAHVAEQAERAFA